MDNCEFCSLAPVAHRHMPTILGRIADLCEECWATYGSRPRKRADVLGVGRESCPLDWRLQNVQTNLSRRKTRRQRRSAKALESVNRLPGDAPEAPDPFDPERYRLPQDFSADLGVKKILTSVPVRKPGRQEFTRVRPGEEWRLQTGLLIDKANRESFLIDLSLAPELAGEITVVSLLTAITRQKAVLLWPVNLAGVDGRTNPWHEAALRAETRWIRLAANMAAGCYDVYEAAAELSEPEWPEETTFRGLLKLAFQTRTIESLDHSVLRALRGEA